MQKTENMIYRILAVEYGTHNMIHTRALTWNITVKMSKYL